VTRRSALAKHVTRQEQAAALLAVFVRRTKPFMLVSNSQVPREVAPTERHIPRTPSGYERNATGERLQGVRGNASLLQ
jgi:hypothetical protein